MARLRSPGRRSRNLPAGVLLVLALPVAALVWLSFQLDEQDRQLEVQRAAERRELAAGRAVSSLEQAVAAAERRLGESGDPGPGAIRMHIRGEALGIEPSGRIAYSPRVNPLPEAARGAFDAADELEFRQANPARAIEVLRGIAASKDPALRAGALVRLARNHRKAGRPEEALADYDRMTGLAPASIDGTPADLIGRRARAALLREMGRAGESDKASAALEADLQNGRWHLDRATFLHLAISAAEPGREALAEAACWVWSRREQLAPSGRTLLDLSGRQVAVLWHNDSSGIDALAALPEYQRGAWFSRLDRGVGGVRLWAAGGTAMFGPEPPPGARQTVRPAAETGLPWNVTVFPEAAPAASPRRRLLLAGLAVLLSVLGAGVYFIIRALQREMAVMRLQSDFVAAVSHEFRTPLTSMRQFTELLMQDVEPPADKRQAFYRAQLRATDRLHRLIESLLDFGRMEAGRHPYRMQPLDAVGFVEGVVDEFRREALPRGFTVDWAPAQEFRISADPDALSRALWNLLENAAKYSGDSRWIGVDIERAEGRALIRVRDRGVGIDAAEQGRIFEKFVRGARTVEQGVKGTGIGLAVVRHIVSAHRGRVEVESRPGAGSTFTISIPAEG